MIQSGMRVEKIVSEYRTTPTAGWYETSRRRYVWAGWLMLLELDGSNNIVRKYTWGLDLAGQAGGRGSAEPGSGLPEALEAAGGIGGLLAVYDLNDTPGAGQTGDDLQYVYTYDGNGNVVQVLDWAASSAVDAIKARYEYDPYGNVVASGGSYAERNPFRFSTKYWDDETGLGYWGYRYYSSRMRRWIGRDPIGEVGGLNVLAYCVNTPTDRIDAFGLETTSPCKCCSGKNCHWRGTITGSVWSVVFGFRSRMSVNATGVDDTGCSYAVSGNGRGGILGSVGFSVGYVSISATFDGFGASCEWPVNQGDKGPFVMHGAGANAGIPVSVNVVQAQVGEFSMVTEWFGGGGCHGFVGITGAYVTMDDVIHTGPSLPGT